MFKNEKLKGFISYIGFISAFATVVSAIMTSVNLNTNHLVKSYLNTKAAIVCMWILFALTFFFGGVMNNNPEYKLIGYVLSLSVLSFILIIINSILLAKKKKIIEKENIEIEKGNKKLNKVNFNISIFSLTVSFITFVTTLLFVFYPTKKNFNYDY